MPSRRDLLRGSAGIALGALAVPLLQACGGGKSPSPANGSPSGGGGSTPTGGAPSPSVTPSPPATTAPPAKSVTLNIAIGSDQPPPQAFLDKFVQKTGNKVNWLTLSWSDVQTKIAASAAANVYFADVVNVDWSRVGTYDKLGWMVPLNKYLDIDALKTQLPQLPSFLTPSGDAVGLPGDASFTVTTINKAHLDKAGISTMPTTLDEYTAALRKVQSAGVSKHPLGMRLAAVEGLSTYWYTVTANLGGTLFDEQFHPRFEDPGSAGYKALQWMIDAYKSGLVDPAMINQTGSQIQQGAMAHGLCTSIFADYSGNVASLYDDPKYSTVTGQIVYIKPPGKGIGLNLPDGIGVPKQAKNPEAAAGFIEWYTSAETQADIVGLNGKDVAIAGSSLPCQASVFERLAANPKLRGSAQLADMFKTTAKPVFPNGVPAWYPEFSNAAYTNIHSAVAGNTSIGKAIHAIVAAVEKQTH